MTNYKKMKPEMEERLEIFFKERLAEWKKDNNCLCPQEKDTNLKN